MAEYVGMRTHQCICSICYICFICVIGLVIRFVISLYGKLMSACTSKIDVVKLIHEEGAFGHREISSVCLRIGLMLLGFRYLVFTGYMGLSIIWLWSGPRKGFYTHLTKCSCSWFLETTNSLSYKNIMSLMQLQFKINSETITFSMFLPRLADSLPSCCSLSTGNWWWLECLNNSCIETEYAVEAKYFCAVAVTADLVISVFCCVWDNLALMSLLSIEISARFHKSSHIL